MDEVAKRWLVKISPGTLAFVSHSAKPLTCSGFFRGVDCRSYSGLKMAKERAERCEAKEQ